MQQFQQQQAQKRGRKPQSSDEEDSDDDVVATQQQQYKEQARSLLPSSTAQGLEKGGLRSMHEDLLSLTTLALACKPGQPDSRQAWQALKGELLRQSEMVTIAAEHGWDTARVVVPSKSSTGRFSKETNKRLAKLLQQLQQQQQQTKKQQPAQETAAYRPYGRPTAGYSGYPPAPLSSGPCWDCGEFGHRRGSSQCKGASALALPGPPGRN